MSASGKDGKKIEIPAIKYFWSSSSLIGKKTKNIPKFLRDIDILSNLTSNELRILSKFLHIRDFSNEELIVKKGDKGIGFYFIYSGQVKIYDEIGEHSSSYLEEGEYFGELALLQDVSIRNANIMAISKVKLLGILKPDLEDLIDSHPKVSAKLIQSLSLIVSNRFNSAIDEIVSLRKRLNDESGK